MATPKTAGVIINNAAGTTAQTIYTAPTGCTRVKQINAYTGPTTAPGGTYNVFITVTVGATEYIVRKLTLVNTADTELTSSPIYLPNLVLGATDVLKAVVRTTITSGATIHVTAELEDLA